MLVLSDHTMSRCAKRAKTTEDPTAQSGAPLTELDPNAQSGAPLTEMDHNVFCCMLSLLTGSALDPIILHVNRIARVSRWGGDSIRRAVSGDDNRFAHLVLYRRLCRYRDEGRYYKQVRLISAEMARLNPSMDEWIVRAAARVNEHGILTSWEISHPVQHTDTRFDDSRPEIILSPLMGTLRLTEIFGVSNLRLGHVPDTLRYIKADTVDISSNCLWDLPWKYSRDVRCVKQIFAWGNFLRPDDGEPRRGMWSPLLASNGRIDI